MSEASSLKDQEPHLSLRRHLVVWSEEHEQSAVELAERHRELLVKQRLRKAQLNGLNSIAQSTEGLGNVMSFVTHQGAKAERADQKEVKDFWADLSKELMAVEDEALALALAAGLELPPEDGRAKKRKAALKGVALAMAREWLQHFVAHSLMLAESEE